MTTAAAHSELHIRKSLEQIQASIEELEKAKAVLRAMLPREKIDPAGCLITLPGGKVIDANGKAVTHGN